MYNKNDPLVHSVKAIMEQNDLRRRVEAKLCEELGIYSRKALPHEHLANYDALLEERMKEATDPSKYSDKQKKLAAVGNKAGLGGDPRKIDAPDLAGARKGHASHIEEASKSQIGDLNVAARKAKTPEAMKKIRSELDAAKAAYANRRKQAKKPTSPVKLGEEEEGDETREGGAVRYNGKPEVSPTSLRAGETSARRPQPEGPSASQRQALTNKIKDIVKESKHQIDELKLDTYNDARKEAKRRKEMAEKGDSPVDKKYAKKYKETEELATRRMKSKMDEEALTEKELTDDEMSKGEEIVKSMKDKAGDFKSRYGKRGKEIMYATATKMAKKLAEEGINIDAVMEEIARNLGEAKMKKVMEQESDVTATPEDRAAFRARTGSTVDSSTGQTQASQPASTVASAADRAAFRARTGSTVDSSTGQVQSNQPSDTVASAADREAFRARTGSTVGATSTGKPSVSMQPSSSPITAPKGEGATGKALADFGVSREQRRNQDFVTNTLGKDPATGKPYVAGSAAANLALRAKMSQQAGDRTGSDEPVGVAARPSVAPRRSSAPVAGRPVAGRPAPMPPRRTMAESLTSTINKILKG